MSLSLVLVTYPSLEKARELAKTIISERLAACVNIIPAIESHYFWEGQIHNDSELLLIIKTTSQKLEALKNRVLALHPYDTPEFVALEPTDVSDKYNKWIRTYLVG